MKKITLFLFSALVFAIPVQAKDNIHYSKVIGQKTLNDQPVNIVALTKVRKEKHVAKAAKIRKKELESLGWDIVGATTLNGRVFDNLYKAIFNNDPASISYLSFKDRYKNDVRINFGNKDGMATVTMLNHLKGEFKAKKAKNIQVITSNPRMYNINNWGISVAVPGGWSIQENKISGNSIIFIIAPLDDQADLFAENFNIMKSSDDDSSLKDYVQRMNTQFENQIEDYKVLKHEELTVNGRDYIKYISTGRQGEYDLKYISWFTAEKGTYYLMTFSAEKIQFDNYQHEINIFLNSFKIISK